MPRLFHAQEQMKTRIYRPTPVNLKRLATVLKGGDLVAVPTETVYGLAADATNQSACKKIFTAKNRPSEDPLIVHVHSLEQAHGLAQWNETAHQLADRFWPGPLTLVLPKKASVSDVITAGLDSVAIRMPSHPVFRSLLQTVKVPLAAPSANPFGYMSPTSSAHVKSGLDGKIPAILEGGQSAIGVESTILDIRNGESPVLLRPGGVTSTELRKILGGSLRLTKSVIPEGEAAIAPGMLKRHYSPKTSVTLYRSFPAELSEQEAWIHFHLRDSLQALPTNQCVLAPDNQGRTAANRLFSILRAVDSGGYPRINIQLVPETDTWADTINDRLERAAAR